MKNGDTDQQQLPGEIDRLRTKLRSLEALEQKHRQTERALREGEELYRAVVENVADAIAITVGTERVFVNKAFLTIHGLQDKAQVIGLPVDQFALPEDRELLKSFSLDRQQGKPMDRMTEYRIRRPDGELRTVQASAVTINYKGRPAMLAVLRDITDLKEAEKRILALNRELEQHIEDLRNSNHELEAFNSTVSHDLRVPLVTIDGFSRKIEERYGHLLDEKGSMFLGIIRKSVMRMNQLIEDLLAYARVGKQQIALAPVSVEDVARTVAHELRFAFPEGGLDLTVGHLPPAYGDERMVRQVFTNLLSNAFKFSGHRELRVISVEGREEENENVYSVRDNGAGFDMSQKEKLFQVFQRLHDSDQFEGTGIGLAIVKRIVERHGGRVWAEGTPGKGAVFFVSLPRKPSEVS